MKAIRELFAKPIDRKIEEVIKVDQADEQTVQGELEEYVVTDSIKDYFITAYDEIIQCSKDPHPDFGIWVSGFFGSGKSSFAKILGYTIANRTVCGRSASVIFKENVNDLKLSGLLDVINRTIPSHAIIFDVSMDRGVRYASERITEIMYKALLRELDYAEDFDLAELEIALESDGLLEKFTKTFEEIHGKPWRVRRKLHLGINEASVVLHKLNPKTYPQPDSYALSIGKGRADITPNELARRAFELAERRAPGRALIFIIDEVGQYVSRSVDKMLDLQAVVQAFGNEGKNRVIQKKAVAPFWIVVTSQEKLNEIVDALGSKKIELARLQDRFRITIDLKQSDIPEITSKRVLEKNEEGRAILEKLYEENKGRLNTFCKLERTSRDTSITKEAFVNLYPYLPYQIDLCIDIVAGLRLKRGAYRHIGGSNRTMIKQAQEMMINPRTLLADKPIGTLVTLDKVYELLYLGNLLPIEITREIDNIPKYLPGNERALQVAKTIALLEVVKDLPRTVHNLSVVLHPSVGADSIKAEVEEAVKALEQARIIRESEDGYKLLTVQEKAWDTQRAELEPKRADRNRIIKELLKEIFSDPKLKSYRYKNLKAFKIALYVENETVQPDGQVPLNILIAEDDEECKSRCQEARELSNTEQKKLFWVVNLTDDIHNLITESYRSSEMVSMHERLASQSRLAPEEQACLSEEKIRRDRLHRQLRLKLTEAVQSGKGFFRGIEHDGSSLGRSTEEIFSRFLNDVIPELYPKLEIGIRPLKGDEAIKFLNAANLNGLPPVFYEGENGLSLVVKEGTQYVPNKSAPVCKEILDYLTREHSYGNKVTGKMLETHFQGIGYGWDIEVIQLALAVLLRSGAIEVTHQGRKYRDYTDPACKNPFTAKPTFRNASFAPREPIDLKVLTSAARNYEEITGREVDIDESKIAEAFKKVAEEDREMLRPLVTRMGLLNLPGIESMKNHLQTVEGIIEMSSEDCVKTLAGEGKTYKEIRAKTLKLNEFLTDEAVEIIEKARRVLDNVVPVLKEFGELDGETEEKAERLAAIINSEDFFESIEVIRNTSNTLSALYMDLYKEKHAERSALYKKALEEIRGMPEWVALSESSSFSDVERQTLLAPLLQRAEEDIKFYEGYIVCQSCKATLPQIESDIAAVNAHKDRVIKKIYELMDPDEKIERVRVSEILKGKLEAPEDVEEAIKELKEYLMKLISSGIKVILE